MIPLIKNTFINEKDTRRALAVFIMGTDPLSMHTQCTNFENAFALKQGRKNAVLFNSGGSANLAMLQSLKNMGRLEDGDYVGISALTWATNVMPIIQLNLIPVAIDCEKDTLNVNSKQLLSTLEEIPLKAMFLTNALGFASDIWEIEAICSKQGIALIEDNCEALGTETKYGKLGNFGLASSFSFFVAHHMSTIEGGMVCTDDEDFAEMLKIVRANGWDRNLTLEQQIKWRNKFEVDTEFDAKYVFYELGYNLRPTEITGFLGLLQLPYVDDSIKKRAKNYLEVEEVMRDNDDLIIIRHDHITQLSPFAIPIICKTSQLKRNYLSKFIKAGVEVRPMIAGNIQKQPFYKKYVERMSKLSNAKFLHNGSFYCGNYPELTDSDLKIIKGVLS
jgi:CDP-6-deoxy-D-xylo-4-hexulose-3-dehydrase